MHGCKNGGYRGKPVLYVKILVYQLDCIVSHHAEMDFVLIDMEADVQTVTGLDEYHLSISFKLSLYNSDMFTKEINKIRN